MDDDALVLMNTATMLEDLGHEPIEATSGARALEVLAGDAAIDLVITDYAMPGMNGAELAQKIGEMRDDIPILLATGYAELPSGQSSQLQRLAKPFFQNDLAKAIEAVVPERI